MIDPGDPADPIARQIRPSPEEAQGHPDDHADPIGDAAYSPLPGLVHRYPDRVLLTPTMTCAVHCRFCFRRDRVGGEVLSEAALEAAMDYIRTRPAIGEVILTGGDPLTLPLGKLGRLIGQIRAIDHVGVIRVHSRVPVAAPERVTPEMVQALASDTAAAVWLAVHVNHPRELQASARAALARLAGAGVPLLAQTVLLKGVNDRAEILEALFRDLLRLRVKPYYLHHPDRAPGTGHFRLTLAEGRALMAALRGRLSGIALPTYVLDIPGGAGKVPVGPDYWDAASGCVRDPAGGSHSYFEHDPINSGHA